MLMAPPTQKLRCSGASVQVQVLYNIFVRRSLWRLICPRLREECQGEKGGDWQIHIDQLRLLKFPYFFVIGLFYPQGANSYGQLGLGHKEDVLSAQQLSDFCKSGCIKRITGGGGHSAVVTGNFLPEQPLTFLFGHFPLGCYVTVFQPFVFCRGQHFCDEIRLPSENPRLSEPKGFQRSRPLSSPPSPPHMRLREENCFKLQDKQWPSCNVYYTLCCILIFNFHL